VPEVAGLDYHHQVLQSLILVELGSLHRRNLTLRSRSRSVSSLSLISEVGPKATT
jgi:hypothetical protein